MANNVNANIQIRKTANGYLVIGNPIRDLHEGNEQEMHVSTKDEARDLATNAFENELKKLD